MKKLWLTLLVAVIISTAFVSPAAAQDKSDLIACMNDYSLLYYTREHCEKLYLNKIFLERQRQRRHSFKTYQWQPSPTTPELYPMQRRPLPLYRYQSQFRRFGHRR